MRSMLGRLSLENRQERGGDVLGLGKSKTCLGQPPLGGLPPEDGVLRGYVVVDDFQGHAYLQVGVVHVNHVGDHVDVGGLSGATCTTL